MLNKIKSIYILILIFIINISLKCWAIERISIKITINKDVENIDISKNIDKKYLPDVVAGKIIVMLLDKECENLSFNKKIYKKVETLYFSNCTSSVLKKVRQTHLLIYNGLKLVVENNEKEIDVFNREIKNKISYDAWKGYFDMYGNIDGLKKYRSLIPDTIEDMKSITRTSLERSLLTWIFFHRLKSRLAPTKDEIIKKGREKFPNQILSDTIKAKICKEILNDKLYKWWNKLLTDNNILIHHDFIRKKVFIILRDYRYHSPFLEDIEDYLQKIYNESKSKP